MKTQDEAIREITRRLVEYYQPVKIYLFGSTARGDAGPDSDLDFCVVVPDDTPVEKLRAGAARRAVREVPQAKDIISWRLSDFEKRARSVRASLPATVVRDSSMP